MYHNTWGHLAPEINRKYYSKVRITFTSHSVYGRQAIILDYINFNSPYFCDTLFKTVSKKVKASTGRFSNKRKTKFANGIWDIPITFLNYKIKLDFKNAVKVVDSLK